MLDDHQHSLRAAQGYSELGMHEDALSELAGLPAEVRPHPVVVEMRLIVLMHAKRWKDALEAGNEMCRLVPDKAIGFIHAAFCLHELGRTEDARELLLKGPTTLHNEPVFHYNLACYECVMGNFDLARTHLDRCFALDKKFRDYAKTDPDLKALNGKHGTEK